MVSEIFVLAGGIGHRLQSITGCSVPKCAVSITPSFRGVDLLKRQLPRNATISADNYYYWYQRNMPGHRMEWQSPGGVAWNIAVRNHPVLTVAPDTIMDAGVIQAIENFHKPGTITWLGTTATRRDMDQYSGMDIVNGAITGRNDKSILRTPTLIIDPFILSRFDIKPGEDLFWDVLPRIEEENLHRVKEGKSSLLNAFIVDTPCFDYGTPERLNTLRRRIDEITNLHK